MTEWSSSSASGATGGATAKTVRNAAGNTYVEVQHFKASDKTELSVWTAPMAAGGGTKPAITVTSSARADVGVAAVEYSGLSSVADTTVVDKSVQASGNDQLGRDGQLRSDDRNLERQ